MYRRAEAGNLTEEAYKQWILEELERHRRKDRMTIPLETIYTYIDKVLESLPDAEHVAHDHFPAAFLALRQEGKIRLLKYSREEWRLISEELAEADFQMTMARFNLHRYAAELVLQQS